MFIVDVPVLHINARLVAMHQMSDSKILQKLLLDTGVPKRTM